ncbi:MAG: hypothetical protein ACQEP8_02910 [Chlamydiota bacterium]
MSFYNRAKHLAYPLLQKLRLWRYSYPYRFQAVLIVLGIHFFVITTLIATSKSNANPPKPQKLVVNTIKISPPQPAPKTTPKKAKPPSPPTKKATPEKATSPKKPYSSHKKEKLSAEKARLLKELQHNMDTFEKTSFDTPPEKKAIKNPQPIAKLSIDEQFNSDKKFTDLENTYTNSLISQLQSALKLPEYGQVKISITVGRDGSLRDLQIIFSENSNNEAYVRKALEHMTLPSFGISFRGEEQQTFNIVLNNKI